MEEKKEEENISKPKIEEENGLNISYDKSELNKFYPHLISEISEKKKAIRIDSIDMGNDHSKIISKSNHNNYFILEELVNPKAIDFIRRCKTIEEVTDILEFLLKRKEISIEEYNDFKNIIEKKGGLKKLIEESGGFKKPGYYERKYYKK